MGVSQDLDSQFASFNSTIGDSYRVSGKGAMLIIEGYRDGVKVKTDKVNIHDLDVESVVYSESEQSVLVKCHSQLNECIVRSLVDGEKSHRNRMVFSVSEGVSGKLIEDELKSLLVAIAKR